MERVAVNKIIPFSAVDGPGNRTAVFLQGCNFDCRYCHNPETRAECINCGDCVKTCPAGALTLGADKKVHFDPEKCVKCDTCIHICRHNASPRIVEMDAEQVMAEIRKNMPFIRGVTVSGGECSRHPQFLTELFTFCKKEGLGTLIDSNGTLDFEKYPQLLAVTDGVMLDIKAFTPEDHRTVTGEDNDIVLKNAVYLGGTGKLEEVRTVCVPTLFDWEGTVLSAAKLLKPYLTVAPIRYKIITYRPMGVREKYSLLPVPKRTELEALADRLRDMGWQDTVVV